MGMFDIKKKDSAEIVKPEIVNDPPTSSTSAHDSGPTKEELKLDLKKIDAAVQISKNAVEIGKGILDSIRIQEQGKAAVNAIREQRISDLARTYAEMEKEEQRQEHWESRFDRNSRLYLDTLAFLTQSRLSKEESIAALETLKEILRHAFD